MDLPAYLDRHGISRQAFAANIGISQAYLSRLISRERQPSASIALRIERETGGQVLLADLMSTESPQDVEAPQPNEVAA